ncbi:MAG: dienelactone hydrolase family protein [Bacteroidetes bacterium]|nr:dienelactone hydrolase family protein [Bacteroidota bacterium]
MSAGSSTKAVTISVGKSGRVSGEFIVPPKPKSILVLAHGAGAGMNHPFLKSLALELAGKGVGTLRYNFLYMEMKKKRPDVPAVAHSAVEAAFGNALESYPKLPVFAGGKSFGGRMTSQWAAGKSEGLPGGLVFFGFPLHPAGNPSVERAEHLKEVSIPMLFHQGTRDALADWTLIKKVCGSLKKATLSRWEGADHSFKVAGKNVLADLAATTAAWMESIISSSQ